MRIRKKMPFGARHSTFAAALVFPFAGSALAAVTISSQPTANMTCSGGVCAPTATDAVLNVGDLETLVASGSVTVTTTGSGIQANNIAVAAKLAWSAQNTLTLDAYDSIAVSNPVTVKGLGGLSLVTNDGGSGGTLSFGKKGHVAFANLSSPLTIDGASYTLAKSLKELAKDVAKNTAGDYALADSYDAAAEGTYAASPIAEIDGTFEGLGNTISHMSIAIAKKTGDAPVGMIGTIGQTGTVANIRLSSLNIFFDGAVTSVGGLIGVNEGLVFGAETSGTISGDNDSYVGGMIGNNDGQVEASSSSVAVAWKNGAAGGLVGVSMGLIVGSSATGRVVVKARGARGGGTAGGLVGATGALGVVENSFATGNATSIGQSEVGGLIGFNQGNVTNSYATGNAATGKQEQMGAAVTAGGLIGWDYEGAITSCYSTGAPSDTGYGVGIGGFVGEGGDTEFATSYWDTTTSGTDDGVNGGNAAGVTGLTTAQLQSGLPTGFDPTIWAEDPGINNGLPYLIANPPAK